MSRLAVIRTCTLLFAILPAVSVSSAQSTPTPPEKVIIDTDIGDDIDDAFAVALALRSPELQILGITTTFGDTETRAKLLDRFLAEAGRPDIPVAAAHPRLPRAPSPSAVTPKTTASPSHPIPTPSPSSSTRSAAIRAKSRSSPSAR
jgi:inosine-uridine nucleoside N-ribohydrolase